MDSSIKRSSWKAGHNRRQSLDPERCPTDSSRNLNSIREWESWLLNSPWTLGFCLPPQPPTPPPLPLSCCLIEPCLTQKATRSLFGDRRSRRHLPFPALHVMQHGLPITAPLYMVMKVWRRDDKAVMSLALWPGVDFGLFTLWNTVQVVMYPVVCLGFFRLISAGFFLAPELCFDSLVKDER